MGTAGAAAGGGRCGAASSSVCAHDRREAALKHVGALSFTTQRLVVPSSGTPTPTTVGLTRYSIHRDLRPTNLASHQWSIMAFLGDSS